MSELSKDPIAVPKSLVSGEKENGTERQFGLMPLDRAKIVAQKYINPSDYKTFLKPYLEDDTSIADIASNNGIDVSTVVDILKTCEETVISMHLESLPRGYGHAAVLASMS